jgi:high-affinity iron transporter
MSAFLLMLREGAEAALILAIVLTCLRSLGRRREMRWVWAGAGAAAVVAGAAAAVLATTIGSLQGRSEEIVEGAVALAAAAVLTWMVLWMARHAAVVRPQLEEDVAGALAAGGGGALAAVGFLAVLREGLETALFLVAAGDAAEGAGALVGGVAGLAAAAAVGAVVYQGGRRIDLRLFFRVTGVLVLLFAAGLAARGGHELEKAGLLPAPAGPVWDLGFGDPESSVAARVAAEVLGWTPAPSWWQVAAYWACLLPAGLAFWRRSRRPPRAREADPAPPVLEPTR